MTITMLMDAKTRKPASSGIAGNLLSPAMRDFWTGMHCLHRYAGRCHADVEAIGRDNLRLLHNTLMGDTHYRKILAEANRANTRQGLPVSRKLFSAVEISAEMFSVQQGCSLHLPAHANQLSLQMVLSGRAMLAGAENKPQTFPRKLHSWLMGSNRSSAHVVKPHDVVWDEPSDAAPHVLTALSAICVVLHVRLPMSPLVASNDIHRQGIVPRIAVVG